MNKQDIINIVTSYLENSDENHISKEIAISENSENLKIFDEPIFAFGSADDEKFYSLKKPEAIGEHFLMPNEWLHNAKTVISFFLPFSEEVIKGNRRDNKWPSEEWLHGRIEGQKLVNKICVHLNSELINAGYESIIPCQDKKFKTSKEEPRPFASFTSNWSERHVAFVCGLGTFGLSKGIITKKGMAGRLGSVVTNLYLEPDKRPYSDIYEYCSMCGACAKICPVNAITIENGKDHITCSRFLDITAEKYKPRYGCGKCQVKVPCERMIPKK